DLGEDDAARRLAERVDRLDLEAGAGEQRRELLRRAPEIGEELTDPLVGSFQVVLRRTVGARPAGPGPSPRDGPAPRERTTPDPASTGGRATARLPRRRRRPCRRPPSSRPSSPTWPARRR